MDKLKTIWSENKKQVLLFGGIGLLALILIIVVIIILLNVFRRYDYPQVEKIMVDSTKVYLNANTDLIPAEDEEVIIEVDDLVQSEYMKELADLSSDQGCIGNVTVVNNKGKLRYVPRLECNNYSSISLSERILEFENIVESDNGLYSLNEYFTYRGEYVNNYVSFLGYQYRILKFNHDKMYLVLADTLNEKITYVYDDRYNETIRSYRGKSDFENSRIRVTLEELYNGHFANSQATLEYMDACVHTRSESDLDKAGNVECHDTFSTPISLLAVYDYMNASIDPMCVTSTSRNCSNYNYLAQTTNKYWLLNGTNVNTYDVYFAGTNGALDLDYASAKKDIRLVISIPSDILYKDGIGTSSEPFTFYEY